MKRECQAQRVGSVLHRSRIGYVCGLIIATMISLCLITCVGILCLYAVKVTARLLW